MTAPITDADLARLAELAEKATPTTRLRFERRRQPGGWRYVLQQLWHVSGFFGDKDVEPSEPPWARGSGRVLSWDDEPSPSGGRDAAGGVG